MITPERLEIIVRTHRGKTFLVKALVKHSDNGVTFHEAKDLVEKIWDDEALPAQAKYDKFAELLDIRSITITKEQFLRMITAAIDSADNFYMDPLQAVSILCKNLTELGGLSEVAKRLNTFADKI